MTKLKSNKNEMSMLIDDKLARNATFICGHRKTGTTLLTSLLDNHPELMTVPLDSGFFYAYYPIYEDPKYTLEEKKEKILNKCIASFEGVLAGADGGDQFNHLVGEMGKTFLGLADKTNGSAKDLLLAMVAAYQRHSPLDKSRHKRWVEKTTSTEIYAVEIKRWFPEAKFIHIIRDPRDNFGSLKSGWEKRYKNFNDGLERLLQSHIERGKLGMELARWNVDRVGKEDYLVVKFEDLITGTEAVMKKIADFLNISFNESLLKPTIWGNLWRGNNFEGKKFTGVSKVNVNRWSERITPVEASVIEFYYSDIMEHFGYKTVFSKSDQVDAAVNQYKWHNYSQVYSYEA